MKIKGQAIRRSDVYAKRVESKRTAQPDDGRIVNGTRVNHLGQFVGHGDVARGLAFFNRSRKLTDNA